MVFTDDEITAAGYQGGPRIVDVVEFVDATEIDPIYYRSSYYLEPESTGQKAYSILRQALTEKNRIGIAKVALRSRVHLAALRARDNVLILETMHWPDEIRSADFGNLDADLGRTRKRGGDGGDVDRQPHRGVRPSPLDRLHSGEDRGTARQKIDGEEIVAPETPEPTRVVDLLEALKASVEATKLHTARRKAG